jgi:FixJ family two-component response regulator
MELDYTQLQGTLIDDDHWIPKRAHQVLEMLADGFNRRVIEEHLEISRTHFTVCLCEAARNNEMDREELIRRYRRWHQERDG